MILCGELVPSGAQPGALLSLLAVLPSSDTGLLSPVTDEGRFSSLAAIFCGCQLYSIRLPAASTGKWHRFCEWLASWTLLLNCPTILRQYLDKLTLGLIIPEESTGDEVMGFPFITGHVIGLDLANNATLNQLEMIIR